MAEQTMLKPCPFCGASAEAYMKGGKWAVQCTARMGSCFVNARTHYNPQKTLAITAWNTRADNALMDDIGELLSELSTYFDSKSDFQDGDYGTQEPNAELHHHAAIEALLKRIGG